MSTARIAREQLKKMKETKPKEGPNRIQGTGYRSSSIESGDTYDNGQVAINMNGKNGGNKGAQKKKFTLSKLCWSKSSKNGDGNNKVSKKLTI